MEANKIILNGETLIDLTADTAIESDVRVGKTFHKANGAKAYGTYKGNGITPTGTLNITKNGTYDVTEYASANVNVPSTEVMGDGRPIEVTSEEEFEAIVASPAEKVGKIYSYGGALFMIVEESDA